MSAGKGWGNGFHAYRETIVADAIEHAAEPSTRSSRPALEPKRPARASLPISWAGMAGRAEPVPSAQAEFRTAVAVAAVRVTGVLPDTAQPPAGSIAISGDVQRLSCDQALELVDALLLVVTRMDIVAEERCGTTIDETCDWED